MFKVEKSSAFLSDKKLSMRDLVEDLKNSYSKRNTFLRELKIMI
jgi:hypothetical protein